MLNPSFNWNPSSSFTLLEMSGAGVVGTPSVLTDITPPGINRLFLSGGGLHNDAAASHNLQFLMRNPQNSKSYQVAGDHAGNAVASESIAITTPILVPAGWRLQIQSVDAIGGGAQLFFSFVYIDFLIGAQ